MRKSKFIFKITFLFLFLLFIFQNCEKSKPLSKKISSKAKIGKVVSSLSLPNNSSPIPFNGNGHNTTWDGRLVIYTGQDHTGQVGWYSTVFRPEKVQTQQGRSVNLGDLRGNGAFSPPKGVLKVITKNENGSDRNFSVDSNGKESYFYQFNALTLAPASGIAGVTNPFRSDANGHSNSSGSYETYDLYVYTQNYFRSGWGLPNSRLMEFFNLHGERVFGRMHIKVILKDAKTENATPYKSILVRDFEVIKSTNGQALQGIEPSVTSDGKLMIFNSNGMGGNGDEIKYTFNSNPENLNGWTNPQNITLMNYESASFKAQYALARKPILSASGSPYYAGESLLGAYPWISWEGSEITFMAAHAHHPTAPARRAGFSVVGRWTGNKIRHVDGAFNKDTKGTGFIRLFTSALGSTSSIWNPMKEIKNPQLPFLFESPSFFMITSNTSAFSELGFRDFVDGRYEVSLPMNPTLNKVTNPSEILYEFDFNATADLSKNHLNGVLSGGASFPLVSSNEMMDTIEQIGARGQGIQFPSSGSLNIPDHTAFQETAFGNTFELFVKPIADLSAAIEDAYLYLINKPGSFSLILGKNRQLHARIWINGKEFYTGSIESVLDLNQWSHVAATHDPTLGLFKVFINGRKVHELKVDIGLMTSNNYQLIIGPGEQNRITQDGFLLHLDEFKFSSVARSSVELADSAGVPYAERGTLSESLLPTAFKLKDVRLPTEINLTADKVQLGFHLFNDKRLSSNNTISCASCHSPDKAFADPVEFSKGVLGVDLERHSPVIFNRLFGSTQMWDGRFTSLEQQSSGPLTHPSEMGMVSYQALVDKLKLNASYVKAFQTVYASEMKPALIENALASFQLSLVTKNSKYDSYFSDGQVSALSQDEIKGKKLFFGKAKCIACHSGPNFSDELYHNTGLFPDDTDNGRGAITNRPSDNRSYKTPTLRNLSSSAPYMHNGSMDTLEQVVQTYNVGGVLDSLRDSEIKPLELTDSEINQLVLFLETLNSEIKPIVNINTSLKSIEEAYPVGQPPINGSWSAWSNQGSCSKLCGGGLQNQTRSCTNPAPSNGGNQCSGSTTQQIACNTLDCKLPVNGGWSIWANEGSCSKTCGGGLQNQKRSCTSPAPSNGGAQCSGLTTQQIACSTQACVPVSNDFIVENNRALKPGEFWGNASLKLVFKNDGNLVLYKNSAQVLWASNTQKYCPRPTSCSAMIKPDGNLVLQIGAHTYWHTQTYQHAGLRLKVSEASPFVQLINSANKRIWSGTGFNLPNPAPTPVHGGWSIWANAGSCSKKCGGGLQNQKRSCTSPAPSSGGAQCLGLTTQQIACSTQACAPVSNDFIVENNRALKPGEFWGNSSLRLFFQHDGNLVLYKNSTHVLWASHTQKYCPLPTSCKAVIQPDGNLVLYAGAHAYWHTQTYMHAALRIKVTETSPYVQLINSVNTQIWSGVGLNIPPAP